MTATTGHLPAPPAAAALAARPRGAGTPPGREARPPGASPARRLAVRLLKRLLPAAAMLLLAAIALWPQWQGSEEARRITFRLGSNLLNEPMRMRDARFRGIDQLGRPYTITASEATQLPGSEDRVELTEPKGDITLQDGAWVLLQARHGLYRRQPGLLDLDTAVVLNHDGGYEVRTDQASIDLEARTARGTSPIEGQGPFGTIEGQGFEAEDGGKVIIVTGPARMVLESHRQ
ncbi:MAG: LPS export ABC transporter periplasmic protein LptC [Acetobacteraceae bacterium]|nr:LPS export ABC transporter periplasmic protein LptC [Acetobacteraceae bacterium]